MAPVTLPEIDADRCVHGLFASATCEACAAACPQRALHVSEEGLGFLEENCDGCGLCEPSCPQAAITVLTDPGIRDTDTGPALFVGCEVTDTGPGCAHRIGLRALAEAWRKGARQLILAKAPCNTCPRRDAATLEAGCDKLNALLASRYAEPMRSLHLQPAEWSAALQGAKLPAAGLSRRQLFRRLTTPAQHHPAEDPSQFPLPDTGDRCLYAVTPVIDADTCVACDACVRVCPHKALVDTQEAYVVRPERCVGCGLCVDACDSHAVAIHPMAPSPPGLKLEQRKCAACGAPFRLPRSQARNAQLCRICEQANHTQRLFQVLENPDDDTTDR